MNNKKSKQKDASGIFQLFKNNPSPPIDPLFVKMPHINVIKSELRYSAKFFQNLRMFESAKWISELLNSISESEINENKDIINFMQSQTDLNIQPFQSDFIEEEQSTEIEDALLQIRSLFDLREYKRCSFVSTQFLKKFPNNQTILFFKVYSTLIKEKLKKEEEQSEKNSDSKIIRNLESSSNF